MVGRLVKKKHIRILEQEFCQFNTHAPTARKLTRRLVEIAALESESEKRLLHILLKVSHVNSIKLLAQSTHPLDKFHVRITLVVRSLRQFLVQTLNLRLCLMQMGKRLRSLLKHSASVLCHQVLGQISHRAVLRSRYRTSGRRTHTCQDLQQRTLARTVLTHQGNTVLLIYLKRNILKKCCAAKLHGKSFN